MVDPNNVTIFARTDEELEEFLLFAIVVAGKTAKTQAKHLQHFLSILRVQSGGYHSPFELIRQAARTPTRIARGRAITMKEAISATEFFNILKENSPAVTSTLLQDALKEAKLGQYTKIEKAFREVVTHFTNGSALRTVTPEQLEAIHGIGPKTARFFILHTQEDARFAALDTHILRYMRNEMQLDRVPKATPTGKRYAELEKLFLMEAERLGKTPADLDLEIWVRGSSKGGTY